MKYAKNNLKQYFNVAIYEILMLSISSNDSYYGYDDHIQ